MAGRIENLRPFPKGVSGNPGGRPKSKPLTEEIERLLEQEAPEKNGRTWAAVIAEALVRRAATGDVQAIAEVANRLEGRPAQSVALDVNAETNLAERIAEGRKRLERERERESKAAKPLAASAGPLTGE